MPTTLGTGIHLPTTTTRTTATLSFPSSHLPTEEHVTIEEVFDAYYDCRKHKRRTRSAIRFEMDFVTECYKLYDELNSGTYSIGKSIAFCVTYPKLREVFAADFRDRVVHHLIINRFNPTFEQEMLDSSFACRKGKGTLYGVQSLNNAMQEVGDEGWYARCDIQGFFMSIDRNILIREIERIFDKYNVADAEWWLWLIRLVIKNRPERNCEIHGDRSLWNLLTKEKSLFHSNGRGLPIGNLTSQVFANIYLSMFDRWVAGVLGSEGRLSRYVDDFVMQHKDKKAVIGAVKESKTWLRDNLKLTMHPRKTCIQQVRRGVRFTGVFVKGGLLHTSKRLIEGTYRLAEESGKLPAKKVVGRMNSRWGLMVHYCSFRLRRRVWRRLAEKNNGRFICINHKKLKERKLKNEKIYESERTY